jgi:hypothetical protein
MKKDLRTSITLYGKIENNAIQWWEWFLFSKELTNRLGYTPNYVGVTSKSCFKSGKILEINRASKRLDKSLKENEEISSIEIYSLPEKFKQAAFDHFTSMVRYAGPHDPQQITITVSSKDFYYLEDEKIIEKLKHFIIFSTGQIYELSASESPFFYASRVNPPSYYKTLKLLREF